MQEKRCVVQWKMSDNSLFAVLLRSPWWISFAIAGGVIGGSFAWLPEMYRVFGAVASLPFIAIGFIAAWKQVRSPSGKRIGNTLDAVRTMSWVDFAPAIEEGFRRDGYEVKRTGGAAADFALKKGNRTTLVAARRWKVAHLGVEPLRVLLAEKRERDAHACIYVVAGEITDNARKFAMEKGIEIIAGPELVKLLPDVGRATQRG